MSVRQSLLAAAKAAIMASVLAFAAVPASAQTLRYANQGDLKSLDPYTLKETTTIAHHGHIYEGLITRDKDLKIIPALAESWETPEPTRWRFHLRKGVKFHNGDPFTADDVLFSAERVRSKGSNFLTNVPADAKFTKIDDYTIDVTLDSPNPILISQWDGWYIMDKKWCTDNNAVPPTPASATTPSYASLNANGTGPFMVESHQPGVKTVFKVNPNWWRKPEHNLKEIIFTPIGSDATRVAALLSGEVDIIEPVPIQDIGRVDSSPNAQVLKGPELRTIFIGMDQVRDELLYSNVKGKNPFKDIKVREAFYKAIDIELIKTRVMRGLSTPSALMIAPQLFKLSGDFTRPKFDPDGAKKLLTEAGYPDGFSKKLILSANDIFPAIAQHVATNAAKVGIKLELEQMADANLFTRGRNRDFEVQLVGWYAGYPDADAMISRHATNPDPRPEAKLVGYPVWRTGWQSTDINAKAEAARLEQDPKKRADMYRDIQQYMMHNGPMAYIFQAIRPIAVRTSVKDFVMSPFFVNYGSASK